MRQIMDVPNLLLSDREIEALELSKSKTSKGKMIDVWNAGNASTTLVPEGVRAMERKTPSLGECSDMLLGSISELRWHVEMVYAEMAESMGGDYIREGRNKDGLILDVNVDLQMLRTLGLFSS